MGISTRCGFRRKNDSNTVQKTKMTRIKIDEVATVNNEEPKRHVVKLSVLMQVPYRNRHQWDPWKKLNRPEKYFPIVFLGKEIIYFLIRIAPRELRPEQQHSVHYRSRWQRKTELRSNHRIPVPTLGISCDKHLRLRSLHSLPMNRR